MPEIVTIEALNLPAGWEKQPTVDMMYAPAGEHTIRAKVGGKDATVKINVTQDAVEALQRDLEAKRLNTVKPYIDFNHERGVSAGRPVGFRWGEIQGKQGVIMSVELSSQGRADIKGGNWSYVSPRFTADNTGKISGLAGNNIAALVNDPAFENTAEIDRSIAAQKQHETSMSDTIIEAVKASKMLTPEEASSPTAGMLIMTRWPSAQSEIEALKAKVATLEKAETEAKKAVAESEVNRAIEAGAIEPKNEDVKAFWVNSIMTQGAPAIEALKGFVKANAKDITSPITPRNSVTGTTSGTIDQRQQHALIEAKKAYPEADYETQWEEAVKLDPTAFAIEEAGTKLSQ